MAKQKLCSYKPERLCAACGYDIINLQYCRGSLRDCPDPVIISSHYRHLYKKCARCGYNWHEQPKLDKDRSYYEEG